jgi:phage-related protein (TIGR01555 family)
MSIVDAVTKRVDGWYNALTGLGNALRDKRERGLFLGKTRLTDDLLESLYHGEDIAARIVDALPCEALRNGFHLNAENDDPDLASRLAEYDKRLKFAKRLKETAIWARLFGGAVIYLGVEDGQAEDQPVNMDAIQALRWAQVLDRRYIIPASRYEELDRYGEPEVYQIQRTVRASAQGAAAMQAGARIHESRLLRIDGALTAESRREQWNGWSDSVLEKVHDVIRDFGTSWAAIGHLLQDASQGVFKIDGLIEAMAQGAGDALVSRMQMIDMSRSIARAIMLDAEREDYHREAYAFTGIPDIMHLLMVRLAAAANMPVIVLLRQSPSGLNATGDADIRLWYDQVREYQTDVLRDPISRFYELVFAAQDFAGARPDAWEVKFDRLWQMTDVEQAALEKSVAERDKIYIDAGVILPEEVAVNRFKARGFSMDTQIDLDAREEMRVAELELAKSKAGEEPEPPPGAPTPGAPAPREDARRLDFIEHRGSEWVVLSHDRSKVLGKHRTKKEAEAHLRAIEAAKHAKAGA